MNLVQLTIFKVGPRKQLEFEASMTAPESVAIAIMCDESDNLGKSIPVGEVQQALNKKIGSTTKIQLAKTLFILMPLF